MVTELRNRHTQGESSTGINVKRGVISDMWAEHVVQPLLVNTSEISLATECVGMILKIGEYAVVCTVPLLLLFEIDIVTVESCLLCLVCLICVVCLICR